MKPKKSGRHLMEAHVREFHGLSGRQKRSWHCWWWHGGGDGLRIVWRDDQWCHNLSGHGLYVLGCAQGAVCAWVAGPRAVRCKNLNGKYVFTWWHLVTNMQVPSLI